MGLTGNMILSCGVGMHDAAHGAEWCQASLVAERRYVPRSFVVAASSTAPSAVIATL